MSAAKVAQTLLLHERVEVCLGTRNALEGPQLSTLAQFGRGFFGQEGGGLYKGSCGHDVLCARTSGRARLRVGK